MPAMFEEVFATDGNATQSQLTHVEKIYEERETNRENKEHMIHILMFGEREGNRTL